MRSPTIFNINMPGRNVLSTNASMKQLPKNDIDTSFSENNRVEYSSPKLKGRNRSIVTQQPYGVFTSKLQKIEKTIEDASNDF